MTGRAILPRFDADKLRTAKLRSALDAIVTATGSWNNGMRTSRQATRISVRRGRGVLCKWERHRDLKGWVLCWTNGLGLSACASNNFFFTSSHSSSTNTRTSNRAEHILEFQCDVFLSLGSNRPYTLNLNVCALLNLNSERSPDVLLVRLTSETTSYI